MRKVFLELSSDQCEIVVEELCVFETLLSKMAATNSKVKKGSDMLVRGVDWKAPDFKLSLAITETLDPVGAQLQIPPKVLFINDIFSHFHYVVQEIGSLQMDETLNSLCVKGVLKPEHQHLEAKGLTHIPHMPQNFQVKEIRFILSHVHNG